MFKPAEFHLNGKIAVFATTEEGDKQALWMRRLGSPNVLQLAAPAEMDYRAIVISPDNNFVYYGVTIKNTLIIFIKSRF